MTPDRIDRALLLPRSGVGVVAPWLVIAPATEVIRIDLRLIDRVEVLGVTESAEESQEEASPGQSNLLLVCGDLEVAVFIADGTGATRQLSEQAVAYTREATKTSSGDLDRFVVIDEDPVVLRGDRLQIGTLAFRIGDVREYALRGANIPLRHGRMVQAAMALLVVAAAERDLAP